MVPKPLPDVSHSTVNNLSKSSNCRTSAIVRARWSVWNASSASGAQTKPALVQKLSPWCRVCAHHTRHWPVEHGLHHVLIHGDAHCGDHMAEVGDLVWPKVHLACFMNSWCSFNAARMRRTCSRCSDHDLL
jgi:hypothetical protein